MAEPDSSLSKEGSSLKKGSSTELKQEGVKVGKTFSGVEFAVPETFDFLINATSKPFNYFDWILFFTLALEILLYLFSGLPSWFFLVLFAFWRLSYNIGLGILLHLQSQDNFLVKRLSPFLEKGAPTREFIKNQFIRKMGADYDFEKVPIEYNCWLLYRALVDFILMNDFVSYFLCVFAFTEIPEQFTLVNLLIYILGAALVVFNWFIKADALRVVKDFAWYWGDFFFLIDSELTFDGVFQMAPHPMYSIGYIGYYGLSLISMSYTVLYVSLAAHLCQFLFLGFVENPHIDKIYNSVVNEFSPLKKQRAILYEGPSAYFRRDLIVFKNFDYFRSADLFTAAILLYSVVTYFMNLPVWFYIVQCVAWRLFHSLGLGLVLKKQSDEKIWTKHYLKYGYTAQDSFGNWKSIYNLSLTMTHTSFLFCALKLYFVPESFLYGTVLLKHTLGVLLIALHVWTSVEVYEVIGDFGWFYGDFFVSGTTTAPEYTGIYRFLNNPEKVMGHAGQYGLALISDSWTIFAIALFSQCMTFIFIHYVERVHMKKLYGSKVRQASGLATALSDKIKPLSVVQQKVSKLTADVSFSTETLLNDLKKEVKEQVVDKAKPKITSIVDNLQEKTTKIARPVLLKDNDLDPSQFKISCPSKVILGQPISVEWSAPEDHSERDWIGIYPMNTKTSNEGLTIISSKGKWSLVGPGTSGIIRFSSDKLPWKPGMYELRYHFDYGYAILAVSQPIEITLGHGLEGILSGKQDVSVETLKLQLLEIWKRLLENDSLTVDDDFRKYAGKEKTYERKANALFTFIKNVYGVEFFPKILDSFPTISLLAEKLQEAISTLQTISEPFHDSDEEEKKESKKDQ